jgi:hypothetical protein
VAARQRRAARAGSAARGRQRTAALRPDRGHGELLWSEASPSEGSPAREGRRSGARGGEQAGAGARRPWRWWLAAMGWLSGRDELIAIFSGPRRCYLWGCAARGTAGAGRRLRTVTASKGRRPERDWRLESIERLAEQLHRDLGNLYARLVWLGVRRNNGAPRSLARAAMAGSLLLRLRTEREGEKKQGARESERRVE